MTNFFWMGGTDSLASKYQNWSLSGGGSPLGAWPGGSPGASDNFFFDDASAVNCTWESSVVSMAAVQSIQQSVTAPYIGILNMTIVTTMQGLILNAELQGSGIINLTGANLTALDDASSRKRYVLNGQKAKIDAYTGQYKISLAQAATYLDNGPYPAMTLDGNLLTLAYNVPTSTVHDHADDATIHIKGAFVANSTGGFNRIGAPNMADDTKVKIKFDNPSITYAASTLDFNMATAFFRGTEIPVTGSQTYGTTAAGITVRHYGVVVFAATPGEVCTIRNQTTLECYSLEVKAGSVFRAQSQGTGKPARVNVQTQPIVRGVWAFHANDGHSYLSPKQSFVANVASGGTGLDKVQPNALLMGNAAGAMQTLIAIAPGTNGHVLTLTGGVPGWAASGGGGGGSGTLTSVATTAPITGGTITTTGTIGISAATTSAAGSMSGADKTKLDTVETNADVTDATNVAAAGALMTAGGTMTGEIEATTLTLNAIPADPATDDKVRLGESGGTSNMLMIRTNDGYIQIGPNNSGFAHIQTDRSQFYFSKPVLVDGGGQVFAYNDGLKLGTGTSAGGGTTAISIADGSTNIAVVGSTTSTAFIKQGGTSSQFLMADGSVSAGGGGGGVTAAMLTSAHPATCAQPGGTITTTGDARQIAYVNGDRNTPITVTNPTADGVRLTVISLTGFGSGAQTAIATIQPILSLVNGLASAGILHPFSSVELIWKTNSMNDPNGDPGSPLISGWHLGSTQNYRAFDQPGFEV